ncbi:hypothetical protein [uncultured Campylobacter sp.]|nr:hypothetical protein [uncultured Campylobacter sp.]
MRVSSALTTGASNFCKANLKSKTYHYPARYAQIRLNLFALLAWVDQI